MDKVYFYNLQRYNKILQQRNALLKTLNKTSDELKGLDIWDEQLAKVGSTLLARRLVFIEKLKPEAIRTHSFITNNKETLDVSYETNSTADLLTSLKSAREKDLRLKTTTVGPHRDDLCITINNQDVRAFASQGQQRTVALSLKLAELKIFEQATGERPVLLLDDVFSELDDARQEKLLSAISNIQSIITTTTLDPIKMFHVEHFQVSGGRITTH